MNYHVVITDTAGDDLRNIGEYIERAAGPLTAERFILRVIEVIESLRFAPDRTRVRTDLRPALHGIHADSHLVFYRIVEDRVLVLRVIHGARDISADIFSE